MAPNDERRIVQTENRLRIFLGENLWPIPRSNSLDGEHMPPEIPAGERGLQARQFVETIDRERAAFIKKYLSKQWPNHSLYHLMVNSKIGDDAVVETIVRAMECHDKSREVGHE